MKKIKKIILIIIISVLTFNLTGCYSDQGLETLTYVIALGIDTGSNNNLKISLQFAIPESSANGSSQSEKSKTMSMEASTISEAISLMNGYTSKKIDLSHCKIIVFSEELATSGISNHISSLVNNVEIRPDCNVIISRCDAEDFLNNSTPSLDKLTARYYEVLLNSKEYTGYTIEMPIGKFFSNLADSSSEATAILGGITLEDAIPNNANEYKANELPIKNTSGIENLGLAVFKDYNLVGELNNLECIYYLILSNQLDACIISVPNIFEENSYIDISISYDKKTKNNVKFVNGAPFITSQINLRAYFVSAEDNKNYMNMDILPQIEEYISSYLESHISDFAYKTSKEFKSDIIGFGRVARTKYLTYPEWLESNWLNNYTNAFFDIDVNINIRSSYLFEKN